jgi:hypothetical protein
LLEADMEIFVFRQGLGGFGQLLSTESANPCSRRMLRSAGLNSARLILPWRWERSSNAWMHLPTPCEILYRETPWFREAGRLSVTVF